MRPYLAIIKDSFRAAFASRVLYVLLGLITLLLLALAPIHYREVLDWKIKRDQHLPDPALLVERLVERKDDPDSRGIARIWDLLPEDLHEKLIAIVKRDDAKAQEAKALTSTGSGVQIEFKDDDQPHGSGGLRTSSQPEGNPLEDFPVYDSLVEELNNIIQDRDFYREEDWSDLVISVSPEAQELIESGVESLSEERSRRLNRLLIADALGSAIQNGAATALDFYYLFWKMSIFSTNTTHQQFATTFSSTIPWFFDKFVMSIGLFIAILVTANIIPETFDSGSLNLLLSKPVSRWGLLVSKFIGGCAFVALCGAYLFAGTWLWLGLGMGIWDRGILFAIPVYILVFAIYYSVSTLVGIWYRSAILSVILTAIFWAVCFGVGYSYSLLDNRMQNGEIVDLVPVSDSVLQVDPLKKVYGWDEKEKKWETKLKASMAQEQEISIGIALFIAPLGTVPGGLGPIYDAVSNTLISGTVNLADPRSMNHQDCFISDGNKINFEVKGKFPRNAVGLLASKQGPISVNSSGELFLLKSESLLSTAADDIETEDNSPNGGESKTNDESEASDEIETSEETNNNTTTNEVELFERIGSTRTTVRNGKYIDLNQKNQEIVVYRRGEISVFEPTDEGYRRKATLEIDTGVTSLTMSCWIRYQGDIITLVLGNGQIITVDAIKLLEKNGYLPETRSAVKQLEASPDGRWVAVVYRNETLWLLDNENPDQIKKASLSGQGSISSVKFDDQNRIWVADRTDRATLYDLESKQKLKSLEPESNWFAFAYRYALGPVYRVFPKPGELYKVVTYLSSTGDTKYNRDVDLALTSETKHPFGPLWSGLGFMVMVLFVACTLFHFKDF